MVQCSVMRPTDSKRVKKQLPEFKLITKYIISNNYHEGFSRTLIYDYGIMRKTDSLLYEMMRVKKINNIQSIGSITESDEFFQKNVSLQAAPCCLSDRG